MIDAELEGTGGHFGLGGKYVGNARIDIEEGSIGNDDARIASRQRAWSSIFSKQAIPAMKGLLLQPEEQDKEEVEKRLVKPQKILRDSEILNVLVQPQAQMAENKA